MPMEATCQPVQLEPFIHQVGGHSSMLCLDESTVCKPLIPQELHFYTTLPPDLARFTPKFKGIIEVCFLEDKDGYITLTAYPPECRGAISCDKKHTYTLDKKCPRIRLRRTEDVEIESPLDEMFEELETEHRGVTHNPWVLKCHRDQLKKMDISGSGSFVQKFILLENLTLQFRYPCVLDLKMGVRQYGDDATPAKRQRQEAKVATSTSGTLGVRICGMQVYQHNLRRFVCRNKYYGRGLTEDGFREALTQFLHNGIRLRTDLLQPMVDLLNQLVNVLENQHFRFYTSSLLIIYDGCDADDSFDDFDGEVELEFVDTPPPSYTPRTQLSDLQISSSVKEVPVRARKLGCTSNVMDDGKVTSSFPVDSANYNSHVPLTPARQCSFNDCKETLPTRQDVDDRSHSSPTQADIDYRGRTSAERVDIDDRKHTPPIKSDYFEQASYKTDVDDRRKTSLARSDVDDRQRTPSSRLDIDDRRQSSPLKVDVDDRRHPPSSMADVDSRIHTSLHRLEGIAEHNLKPSPRVTDEHKRKTSRHVTDDHKHKTSPPETDGNKRKTSPYSTDENKRKASPQDIDNHRQSTHTTDQRDLLTRHTGRRDSHSGSTGRRDSPSAGTGRRDSPSASTGRRDSPSASTGRRDSPSAGTGRRDSPSAGTGRRDSPSAGTGRRDSPSAGTGRRDSPSAGTGRHDSPSAGTGRRDSPSASTGRRDSPSASTGRRDSPSASTGRRDSHSGSTGRHDSHSGNTGRLNSLSGSNGRPDSLSGVSGRRDSHSASDGRQDFLPEDSTKHESSGISSTSHATSAHTNSSKSSKMHTKHEPLHKLSSEHSTSSSSSGSDHTNGKARKKVTVIPRAVPPSDCKVDVRMIDFAHSTHSGLDGGNFSGPDRGYIFGLLNLIKVLTSILDEYT